ncbi:MAG: methylated-DNA--[protein]-cysteine S-methyltransferase [Beijerinckiaceae bacterium]
MTSLGFTLFDTAIGVCGIAWTAQGMRAVQLPEANEALTRARLLGHCPGAEERSPPPEAAHARNGIVALLDGARVDLSGIRLDMDAVPPFHRQVYAVARKIEPGSTLTYGEVAQRLGMPGAARAVGQALGGNPFAIIVPCHRIVAKGGKSGGFSAPGGVATKLRLLAIEGANPTRIPGLFD